MNNLLVSVIVTTYNRGKFLKETLDSIKNQTYSNVEILVIDDGSDSVNQVINKSICAEIEQCNYYYKDNSGQPDSRNFGISLSKGALVGFCDDDDLWHENKLELQVSVFNDNPEIFVVTGDTEYITLSGKRTGNVKSHYGHYYGNIFNDLLIKNRTSSITPVLKREVFEKVGYFNPDFKIAEDWEFYRRVSYFYKFYYLNKVLAYVRLHDANMSLSRTEKPLERFLLYRKLTFSLMEWGKGKFQREVIEDIGRLEWAFYRKILRNHFSGLVKKLNFLFKVSFKDFQFSWHILKLYLKYER